MSLTAQDIQQYMESSDFEGIVLGIHKYRPGFLALRTYPPLDKRNKGGAGVGKGDTIEEALANLFEIDKADRAASETPKQKPPQADALEDLLG